MTHAQSRRFTRQEYYRLAETVLGPEERVELIEGEVVAMPPQNLPHSQAIEQDTLLLIDRFRGIRVVRCQLPITLSDTCEPEPDFALVTPEHRDACAQRGEHPSRPDLVIEVADMSLSYDRNEKASLYARAGIPEYWILNLRRRCLELRLDPGPDQDSPFGYAYASLRIVPESGVVAAAFAPHIEIRVSELLPPV